MKFLFTFSFVFFMTGFLFGQEQHCDCSILDTPGKKYIDSEIEASKLLNGYIKALWEYSKIKEIKDPFMIKEAICTSPVSIICETILANGTAQNVRLILYNNVFLKKLSLKNKGITLVDRHVLLHELGHHVLGHHTNAHSIDALNILYQKEHADPKLWNKYGAENPMAKELEADIYAVWALYKLETGFTVNEFVKELNGETVEILDREIIRKDTIDKKTKEAIHGDHPLFKDRIATMRKFELEMRRKRRNLVTRSYFSDIASTAYLDLWPQAYVYDVSLSAGTALAGRTDFSVDGEKTDAFLYPVDDFVSYHVGLSVSRFRWDKPLQTELDVQYSQHKYGTTINTNDGRKLAETLRLNYLTICPKLTWNSIGTSRQSSLRSLRVGFLASVGINARFPIGKVDYTNFIATAPSLKSSFSVGPKVSVGAAILKKSFLPRGFKVLFSYDPQWIRLKATPKPSAISHNLECTLQYSIFRK